MAEKEKIQMFDDGSKAFKVLYQELKEKFDIVVHKVDEGLGDNDEVIIEWFTKAIKDLKAYLHFTNEELTQNDEQARKQIAKIERLGFRNNIVLPNEGMDNKTVETRYAAFRRAGVFAEGIKEDKKEVAEIAKKYRAADEDKINPKPKAEQPTKVILTSQDKTLSAEIDAPKKVESTHEVKKSSSKKKHWYK